MPQSTDILISLGSFGAAEVRRHGQLYFAKLALDAGLDGVEVRGELLVNGDDELASIAGELPEGKVRVFSSYEGLFSPEGKLDRAALDRGLAAARKVGAPRLKMSIGGWTPASAESIGSLADRLGDTPVELVVENDQTPAAGTLTPMKTFLEATRAKGLQLGMTFDVGNWHWTGECPLQAAETFAKYVVYVHCKGVQRERQKWIAVPLVDSAAPYRAVVRAMPAGVPWAIEYPLIGDDLLAVTQREVQQLRAVAGAVA